MENLYPDLYSSSSSLFEQEKSLSSNWTREENKMFESALAMFDERSPDRWLKVAEMIPGKTVWDVIKQYKDLEEDVSEIEAGRVPIPGYNASNFPLELMEKSNNFDANGCDQERRKGVPWTVAEHVQFLKGLQLCGKGEWRSISQKYVISKTSTQVASHAQKYFKRQESGAKDKRRPSIHDITIASLPHTILSDSNQAPLSDVITRRKQKYSSMSKVVFNWDNSNDDDEAETMVFGSRHGNPFRVNGLNSQIC